MIQNELIDQSIDYIMKHLNEEITIEDVASHCHFSKYHFSRIFKAETGESLYAFIKRLKMEQSAINLKLEKEKSVTDIGLDYGYSSSNYSSAFRKHHAVSPAEFRRELDRTSVQNPFFLGKTEGFQAFEEYDKIVQIKELPCFSVIHERHIGNYLDLGPNWMRFTEHYQQYFTDDTVLLERFYDDPTITGTEQCLYDLCMTVEDSCCHEQVIVIEGGKYAVFRYKGPVDSIFSALQGVFSIWFPRSGYQMKERYGLNLYRKMDWEALRVTIDLCIPVK